MNTNVLVVLVAFGFLSVVTIFWLIRKEGTIAEKLFWSFIALIPLIGPVFVGAFYRPPSRLPEHLQDKRELDILPGHYWEREDTNHFDDD